MENTNFRRRQCIAGLFCLLILTACIPEDDSSGTGPLNVVRVFDGDTILVNTGQGKKKVRMVGIDAPETAKCKRCPAQPFAQKSKARLRKRIEGKPIFLVDYGHDRYGRILGVVFFMENDMKTDINLEMIRFGLAEVYGGRLPDHLDAKPYRTAQKKARMNKVGMWVQGDDYLSPITWKHRDD